MTLKKIILVVLICAAAAINCYSQTKQESIKELFHLMKQDSLMDNAFTSMIPTMLSQIKDSTARVHSNEMMNSARQTVLEMTKKMINEDVVVLYDKYFSQNEINDFIAFYKSPSGRKLINASTDIQKDLMKIMMQKYIPEIQKSMKAKSEAIKNAAK